MTWFDGVYCRIGKIGFHAVETWLIADDAAGLGSGRDVQSHTGDFDQLIPRNGRCSSRNDGRQECGHFCLVTFVLTPAALATKSQPAITAQPAKVVELQHPSRRKHLEPLFRERPMPVGEIMNCSERTIRELERACDLVIANHTGHAPAKLHSLHLHN